MFFQNYRELQIRKYMLKCIALLAVATILGAVPVNAASSSRPDKISHLTQLKDKPFKEKLYVLPDMKRPSEKELYFKEEIVKKDKWRVFQGGQGRYLKPVERWDFSSFFDGIAVRPLMLFLMFHVFIGEPAFWNDDVNSEPDLKVQYQTPISPFIYSLFDDINPFDSLLVLPAWLAGFTRIKTRKTVIEETAKSTDYDDLIEQMAEYDRVLEKRNREIATYNAGIQSEIEALNEKIEKHNTLMQRQYRQIVSGGSNIDAIVNRYNGDISKTNRQIALGKMPDQFPSLSTAPPRLMLSFKKMVETGKYVNSNGVLDAGESAELVFVVKNIGKGDGYDVTLSPSFKSPYLSATPVEVGLVAAGKQKQVRLPISQSFDAKDDTVRLTIIAKEAVGYDADPLVVKINTRHIDPPDLQITSVAVRDAKIGLASGNGNGRAENGETVELAVIVRNSGKSDALGIILDAGGFDSRLKILKKTSRISTIQSRGEAKALFAIAIPKTYTAKLIAFTVNIVEERNLGNGSQKLSIPYHRRMPKLDTQISFSDGMYSEARGYRNGKIEKGEQVELKISVKNTGDGAAENVKIRIRSDQTGVTVVGREAHIGTIPAGETGVARLAVAVQRRFVAESLDLDITVAQDDMTDTSKQFAEQVFDAAVSEIVVGRKDMETPGNFPPKVIIYTPNDQHKTMNASVKLAAFAIDDTTVSDVRVTINGKSFEKSRNIGVKAKPGKSREIDIDIPLVVGENRITISAMDDQGKWSNEARIEVTRLEAEKGETYVVSIGINAYRHVRQLKYSVNDATAFSEYAVKHLGIPQENVMLITDEQASKMHIQFVLGDELPKKAGREDTVIIFFAGHGAPNPNMLAPDPDKIEKFILPVEADEDALFSTAIPMDDIATIISRIQAQRVVFIADTCYSGASGGRTVFSNRSFRGNMSDRFLDRLAAGKGRVILTACEPGELAGEDDKHKHGLFTYYLLKGLKGPADMDHDGNITTDEIYAYLARKMPDASGQSQHPVKKGEGNVTIGVVR